MRRLLPFLLLPLLAACDSAGDDAEVTIREIEVGDGTLLTPVSSSPLVAPTSTARFHVVGRISDSCTFLDTELPITVGVGQIIRGLDDGLIGMRVGGVREITVPPELAWGSRGQDFEGTCSVPGGTTVVFTVTALELVEYTETDIVVGEGEEAAAGRSATVTYEGRLDDGAIFDDGTFTFTVGAGTVVDGFDRAVRGMRVGGTREVSFPPTLGYGGRSQGSIPPWSILHFTITLDAVN